MSQRGTFKQQNRLPKQTQSSQLTSQYTSNKLTVQQQTTNKSMVSQKFQSVQSKQQYQSSSSSLATPDDLSPPNNQFKMLKDEFQEEEQKQLRLPTSNIIIKKPNHTENNSPDVKKSIGPSTYSKINLYPAQQIRLANKSEVNSPPKQLMRHHGTMQIIPEKIPIYKADGYDTNSSSHIGEEKTLKDDHKEIRHIQLAQVSSSNITYCQNQENQLKKLKLSQSPTISPEKKLKVDQLRNQAEEVLTMRKGKSETNLYIKKQKALLRQTDNRRQEESPEIATPFESHVSMDADLSYHNRSGLYLENEQECQIMRPNKSPLLKKVNDPTIQVDQFQLEEEEQNDFDFIILSSQNTTVNKQKTFHQKRNINDLDSNQRAPYNYRKSFSFIKRETELKNGNDVSPVFNYQSQNKTDEKVKRSKVIVNKHKVLQIIEYEKKIFEVDSRIEIEKRKNDQLMRDVQRLLMENNDLEQGVDALKRENLDFLEYMNSIMIAKHHIYCS